MTKEVEKVQIKIDEVENKLTKALTSYIFNVEEVIKELLKKDIPELVKEQMGEVDLGRYIGISDMVRNKMDNHRKVFRYIKDILDQICDKGSIVKDE